MGKQRLYTEDSSRLFAVVTMLVVLAVGGVVLASCGDDNKVDGSSGPTTTEEKDTKKKDTNEKKKTTTTTSTTVEGGGEKVEPTGDVDESDTPAWQRSALPFRDQVGETVDLECTPEGDPYLVWGTNLYTDDSSVCTAAVQVGLITFEDGGTVTIKIEAGTDDYPGSTHNDVTSQPYNKSWDGSFSFPDAEELEVAEGIAWTVPASDYADQGTAEVTVVCSPNGEPDSVWGTGTYTDDSSICTAAVHAGLITLDEGGEVTFMLTPGEESYEGSEAHGITSADYDSWLGSFVFSDQA
jgi:hypothetical protein